MNGSDGQERTRVQITCRWVCFVTLAICAAAIAACANPQQTQTITATPTTDPAIYNQVPETFVFEQGVCTAVLNEPAPAHTSNTLGGEPSGEIPAGRYEVGVAVTYSTSQWYALNDVGTANYVNSNDISSFEGNCDVSN